MPKHTEPPVHKRQAAPFVSARLIRLAAVQVSLVLLPLAVAVYLLLTHHASGPSVALLLRLSWWRWSRR